MAASSTARLDLRPFNPGQRGETLTVAIATFGREAQLLNLLEALEDLEIPQKHMAWVATIVVDNSETGTAAATVEQHQSNRPQLRPSREIIYIHEPSPGIAAARNRALRDATTDLVAFIDDDERPHHDWLVEFDRVLGDARNATAIVGPVKYCFPDGVPPQIRGAELFVELELSEGTPPPYLATGNVLFRRTLLDTEKAVFDERFGLIGGSDHQLGLRLAQRGDEVLSAPKAFVEETVPFDRLGRRWIVRRLIRNGSVLAYADLSLTSGITPRLAVRVRHMALATARVVLGTARVVVSGRDVVARWSGIRQISLGLGEVAGAVGRPVGEYLR